MAFKMNWLPLSPFSPLKSRASQPYGRLLPSLPLFAQSLAATTRISGGAPYNARPDFA